MSGLTRREEQVLRSALAKAEQERDEARGVMVLAARERDAAVRNLADAQKDNAANADEAARLKAERDAAVADNAALISTIRKLVEWDMGEGVVEAHAVLHAKHPHPGAALLEQHRKDMLTARREDTAHIAGLTKELEEARRADDNVKAFAEAFCSTVEHAELLASTPKGGQSVPNHNDFAHVQPSTRGQLRWWAKCGRAALKGERSKLLARARNEGLEKAAKLAKDAARCECNPYAPCTCDWTSRLEGLHGGILALKEPEE